MPTTHDKSGRAYAKLSELKAGDRLVADGGFDCLEDGQLVVVKATAAGGLFVICAEGEHYLDGQADDGEHLVGLYREVAP